MQDVLALSTTTFGLWIGIMLLACSIGEVVEWLTKKNSARKLVFVIIIFPWVLFFAPNATPIEMMIYAIVSITVSVILVETTKLIIKKRRR